MEEEKAISQVADIWQDQATLVEIKKIYGEKLNPAEFSVFINIGKVTGLSPFLRELWAVKYGDRAAQIFIGRDGYRKAAQSYDFYDYHVADAVYENDDFNVENGEIQHKYNVKNRGELVGAYCVTKRVNSTKTMFNYVELKEYKKKYANAKDNLWDSKPATMIKKVAEAQGLRMAFPSLFAGTYDEAEGWDEGAKRVKGQVNVVEKSMEAVKAEIIEEIQKAETMVEFQKATIKVGITLGLTEQDINDLRAIAIDKKAEILNKLETDKVEEVKAEIIEGGPLIEEELIEVDSQNADQVKDQQELNLTKNDE